MLAPKLKFDCTFGKDLSRRVEVMNLPASEDEQHCVDLLLLVEFCYLLGISYDVTELSWARKLDVAERLLIE